MIFNLFFSFLFWPVLIIGLIIFFVRKGRHSSGSNEKNYLQIAFTKEESISQAFILLSFFFFGVTLLAFNRDLGDPLSWRAIILITSLVGLFSGYYLKTISTLVFSLVGIVAWWGAQASEWYYNKSIKTAGIFAGMALLALLFFVIGHLHEKNRKYKRFALVYLVLGIMAVTSILFFLSTKQGIGEIESITTGTSVAGSWELSLSLLVFAAALVGATLYGAVQRLISPIEVVAIFALTFLFGITVFLPKQVIFLGGGDYYYVRSFSDTGILWAIVYNVSIFIELLGLMFAGYARRETWLINLGAFFLFILIIAKYFDWFFTFLDKSVFFIGAGILLFIVGWFMERGRRRMISTMNVSTTQ